MPASGREQYELLEQGCVLIMYLHVCNVVMKNPRPGGLRAWHPYSQVARSLESSAIMLQAVSTFDRPPLFGTIGGSRVPI